MTYVRPSYSDLNSRIAADLAAVPAVLRGPLSAALARTGHLQHGHLEWIAAQCSPLTCELERLADWAALYNVKRLLASEARGDVLATGIAGTPVLADVMMRGTNGLDYVTLSAVTLGIGQTSISVRCTSAGSAGNLIAGQTLTLIDPVAGCDYTLTVGSAGIGGGAEDEDVDDWRLRVADEWQVVVTRGSRSGKPDDYRAWAKSAHQSVTGALVQLHALGLGTVLVRPICDSLTDRLPTQAVLDAVAAYFADVVPATADWRLAAPLVHRVGISIHLLPGFDTEAARAAIYASTSAMIMAETSETAVLALAEIDSAIAQVTTQYTRVAPSVDISVAPGEVFVPQAIVWP